MAPIEFLDGGPSDRPAELLPEPAGRPALRWLGAGGAAAALVLAGLIVRGTGGNPDASAPASSPAPSGRVTEQPVPAPYVIFPGTFPGSSGGAGVVYLAGCTGCARVLEVPNRARRAVLRIMPGAVLSGAYTVISATTGRVFTRGLVAHRGAASLTVEVTVTIEGPGYSATQVDGRRRVAEVQQAGYHVTVRTRDLPVRVSRLLHLAGDEALTADQ